MQRKRILIFCDYYLPGYKSGGGTLSVVNLAARFANNYDFYVVTRNHDCGDDHTPYETVRTEEWNTLKNERVFYVRRGGFSIEKIAKLFREVNPDLVYLNSAFSLPVRTFLEARRKGRLEASVPVVLAPCGEFSAGALSLKPLKKKLFLTYAKAFGLYADVIWKGSFEPEAEEIRRIAGRDADIKVAPDLAPPVILPDYDPAVKPIKTPGRAAFGFISRLSRKKNIHYFLERLRDVRKGEIEFAIIGPLEDTGYLAECQKIIAELPPNLKIQITGAFERQEDALRRLSECHFFVLPTLNENFGYVFVEAMAAGCPMLISENTVWESAAEAGAAWVLPLGEPDKWLDQIARCVSMEQAEYAERSEAARRFALEWLQQSEHVAANARVLEYALSKTFAASGK